MSVDDIVRIRTVFVPGWLGKLMCIVVIVCVAGVLIAPTVDLPDTNLKSFRMAHSLLIHMSTVVVLGVLDSLNGNTGSQDPATNGRISSGNFSDYVRLCTNQFLCTFLC